MGGHRGAVTDLDAQDLYLEGVAGLCVVDCNWACCGVDLVPADAAEQLRLIVDGVGEAVHGAGDDFFPALNMQLGFMLRGQGQNAAVGIDGLQRGTLLRFWWCPVVLLKLTVAGG